MELTPKLPPLNFIRKAITTQIHLLVFMKVVYFARQVPLSADHQILIGQCMLTDLYLNWVFRAENS